MTDTLLEKTIKLMEQRKLNPREIKAVCDQMGVSTRWYSNIKNRKYTDPGVNKVEKLHQILSGD